jgi:hypothetical protein
VPSGELVTTRFTGISCLVESDIFWQTVISFEFLKRQDVAEFAKYCNILKFIISLFPGSCLVAIKLSTLPNILS